MAVTSFSSPAVQGCLDAVQRCLAAMDCLAPEDYAASRQGYESIGAHLRHILDHFACLFRGLDVRVVDYDARDRDPNLESSLEVGVDSAKRTLAALGEIPETALDEALRVLQRGSAEGPVTSTTSTLERELVFLSGHTIHHLAIIALLADRLGASIPTELSLAYSSAAHRSALAGRERS